MLEDKLTYTGPKDNMKEAWSTFKDSLISKQSFLCFIISVKAEQPNWVTDTVQEVVRKKEWRW